MKDEKYISSSKFKKKGFTMNRIKIETLIKEKKQYPINGFTQKPYKSQNYHNLNDSKVKNGFEHNIWLSENQCERLGVKLIEKDNPSYTVGRFGEENKIFNISQTDFIKPKRKKSVTEPKVEKLIPSTPSSDEKRIEMLEIMVLHLYGKLGYSINDVNVKDFL